MALARGASAGRHVRGEGRNVRVVRPGIRGCSGTYSVEVHEVLANDQHIVAFLHATADHEGKHLDQSYAIVFQLCDGKVQAAWEIWKDQPSVDQFWA